MAVLIYFFNEEKNTINFLNIINHSILIHIPILRAKFSCSISHEQKLVSDNDRSYSFPSDEEDEKNAFHKYIAFTQIAKGNGCAKIQLCVCKCPSHNERDLRGRNLQTKPNRSCFCLLEWDVCALRNKTPDFCLRVTPCIIILFIYVCQERNQSNTEKCVWILYSNTQTATTHKAQGKFA